MFTDTHAHLASKQFVDDLPQIIERARAAQVTRIICLGTTLEDSHRVLEIAETYPEVEACVGIHPCDADTEGGPPPHSESAPFETTWIDELKAMALHPKVVGIGEIGLDYFHAPPEGYTLESWKRRQAQVLDAQLTLAAELGLNVVLHNRESFDDLREQVLPWSDRLRGVFHCFTGTWDDARPLIERGHLVSFTGIVTFKNGQIIQETARAVPADAFMLETDCPYLAPMPHRGKRNEPAFVSHTTAFTAQLRGTPVAELAAQTGETARKFFQKRLS